MSCRLSQAEPVKMDLTDSQLVLMTEKRRNVFVFGASQPEVYINGEFVDYRQALNLDPTLSYGYVLCVRFLV